MWWWLLTRLITVIILQCLHFELLCCTPETNMLYVSYISLLFIKRKTLKIYSYIKKYRCKVKLYIIKCVSTQPWLTLCDIMACQTPLSMEFSRQESWSGLPFSTPEALPNPGIEIRKLWNSVCNVIKTFKIYMERTVGIKGITVV